MRIQRRSACKARYKNSRSFKQHGFKTASVAALRCLAKTQRLLFRDRGDAGRERGVTRRAAGMVGGRKSGAFVSLSRVQSAAICVALCLSRDVAIEPASRRPRRGKADANAASHRTKPTCHRQADWIGCRRFRDLAQAKPSRGRRRCFRPGVRCRKQTIALQLLAADYLWDDASPSCASQANPSGLGELIEDLRLFAAGVVNPYAANCLADSTEPGTKKKLRRVAQLQER